MRARWRSLTWFLRLAAAVALCIAPTKTWAAPQNGFGLATGLALHSAQFGSSSGTGSSYATGGASLAGDAQFVITDDWSLNPYLLLSLEVADTASHATVSNGAAGLELRRWWGDSYLGVRAGEYVELYAGSVVSTNYGWGAGISAGLESPDAPTWGVILDISSIGTYATIHVGLRLQVGWRWGDT